MEFPERFSTLPEYAFPRLRALLDVHAPGGDVVHMTIGEPKHVFPAWVTDVITEHAAGFNRYPPNEGAPELRSAMTDWIQRRYGVAVDPETEIMPLNGTREGLYNAAMALCPETKNGAQPIVLAPNPFYQVYMVAAYSVAAEPLLIPATSATGHLPDFASLPADVLNRTAIAYLCSPANPQGAVASKAYWADLIRLAETYDFKIFADECYCEIYRDTAPPGALEVAREMGADPERVVIFHSLSKRSNLPGLRSGFIASGPENMRRIRQLRTYAGTPLPLPLQYIEMNCACAAMRSSAMAVALRSSSPNSSSERLTSCGSEMMECSPSSMRYSSKTDNDCITKSQNHKSLHCCLFVCLFLV